MPEKNLNIKAVVLSAAAVLVLILSWHLQSHTVNPLDRPFFLPNREETIRAVYVDYMCNCPKFVESYKLEQSPIEEINERDFFYVESENTTVVLHYDSLYLKPRIVLKGRFYRSTGIPDEFELGHIEDKPDRAKVFRYSQIVYANHK